MSRELLAYTQEVVGYGGAWWVGRRSFQASKGDAASEALSIWEDSWEFNESLPAITPRTVRVVLNDPENPGKARIDAEYGYFNIRAFPVNSAVLSVETNTEAEKLTVDLSGEPIEVDSADQGRWQPVYPGSNIILTARTLVRISTAYYKSEINWNTILGLVGKVNSSALPNVGNAGAKTLWLAGAGIPRYYLAIDGLTRAPWTLSATDPIIPIQYVFLYRPYGWPLKIKAQKYFSSALQVPVLAEEYGGTGTEVYVKDSDPKSTTTVLAQAQRRTIERWKKSGDAVDRTIRQEGDFSDLFGLISW